MEYDTTARRPREISAAEIDHCISLVCAGGAADSTSVRSDLPKAKLVAVVRAGKQIVGVGAIKRPRPRYARKIAHRSQFALYESALELGYVAVDPAHRGWGLSNCVVQQLLSAYDGPLFATTANERMKKALGTAGFEKKGQERSGRYGQLSLWLKERASRAGS